MFSLENIEILNRIKENERQKISLIRDREGKKYLLREIEGDKREIYKTLQKLMHICIPRIYYVGFDEKTIVVEEYIEGATLTSLLVQGKIKNKRCVRRIAKQILSALEVLHAAKVMHRDVKPDNVLLDEKNHVWLIDYDIARIYREELRKDTEVMGTFGYAPPEQYGMLPTDFKTDIYAFGVTFKMMLDAAGIRGGLLRIAEKCKFLDPAHRYPSARAVARALRLAAVRWYCVGVAIVLLAAATLLCALPKEQSDTPKQQAMKTDTAEQNTIESEKNAETEMAVDTFEGTFDGFQEGPSEVAYSKYWNYADVCIFSMPEAWEHLLLLDDMHKSGRLKLGKNETVISADFALRDGQLEVHLDDGSGNVFQQSFAYSGVQRAKQESEADYRKNADIVCYDFDGDGGTELLLGINSGSIGTVEDVFYTQFDYCSAWCVRYDAAYGFVLCDGEMFSENYAFWVNEHLRKLNVTWEDIGEPTGYGLEGNTVKTLY